MASLWYLLLIGISTFGRKAFAGNGNGTVGDPCNDNYKAVIDCIEGLVCRVSTNGKDGLCDCPKPCVYVAEYESCKCVDYPELVYPILVGIVLGAAIIYFWYKRISKTWRNFRENKEEIYSDGETGIELSSNSPTRYPEQSTLPMAYRIQTQTNVASASYVDPGPPAPAITTGTLPGNPQLGFTNPDFVASTHHTDPGLSATITSDSVGTVPCSGNPQIGFNNSGF